VSSSTDASSPITAIAWALGAGGLFQAGGPVLTTSFTTPGGHLVRLRVTDAYGASSTATETIDVVGSRAPLMQPFPVVRIAGAETRWGVRLRLLSVQAPRGARITVRCRGRGCPLKSASRVSASGKVGRAPLVFRRFERSLRPGVTLEVRVSKRGEIGKYTRFAVRRGRLPVRVDMCLDPAGTRPLACPSS
jgi:PKD domain